MDGFEWDQWNRNKNWVKHKVTYRECEEVFFNSPSITYKDIRHSQIEKRHGILGKTDNSRLLHITFTVRKSMVRIISARDMNKKERVRYAKKQKTK